MHQNSQENKKQTRVPSPCISNCCLDEADICLGCFRHIDEITGWHSASDEVRKQILQRAQARKDERSIGR